ncbi:MAG: hypothetical protein DLM61_01925, partial [Pseudonocardiales bacterium]
MRQAARPDAEGNTAGWPAWTWGALIAGTVILVLFGLHQRRSTRRGQTPLVEASLFHNRGSDRVCCRSIAARFTVLVYIDVF